MITTKNIEFFYPNQSKIIFPDINCSANEPLLITGKSGSGKTTLLHLLSGILKPSSGEIIINNQNISFLNNQKLDAFRGKHIGVIWQQSYFIESLHVLDNLLLAQWLASGEKNKNKALNLLETLEISNTAYKKTTELSFGQQQRVSIARALMNNPSVILADEPTSALDDDNTSIVAQLLLNMSQKHQASLIIVTHDNRLKSVFNNQIELL
jgi:ABC-type lipoprotein export system ATPase subunit